MSIKFGEMAQKSSFFNWQFFSNVNIIETCNLVVARHTQHHH